MNDKEIHLRDYLRIISKRRYTLYTFFLITLTIVLITTFTAKPLYLATTRVLIERSEQNPLANNYAYMAYDPEFLETQAQIIKSSGVGRRVVEKLGLVDKYEAYFAEKEGASTLGTIFGWLDSMKSLVVRLTSTKSGKVSQTIQSKETLERTKADNVIRAISSGLTVEPVRNTRIVVISFMSPSSELSKMVVDAAAQAYIDELLDMKMTTSNYSINWMTKKAEEERAKLANSEKALQQYVRAKNIVTVEDRIAVIPQRLAELSREQTMAEAKRKDLEAVYRMVAALGKNLEEAESIPLIAQSHTLQSIREEILKQEQHIMELSKKYGEKHPVMIRARSELNVLKDKRAKEIRMLIKSIKNEYELAISSERELGRRLAETKEDAVNLNEKFVQYGILKREVETNKNLYEALIKQIKEEGVTEKIQTVNVWVVDKAETPMFPAKPQKARNIMLGIILGLFGGVGLAFFVEYLDNTIKTPDDAEDRFGLPVLGTVPLMKEKKRDLVQAFMEEPASHMFEGYKGIRTAVTLSSANSHPKAIQITSSSTEEGKTTTAANLAVAMAQSEKTVVLVDGDLRKPRVHTLFSSDNQKGLSTYLAGVSNDQSIKSTRDKNLSIITSGPIPPNPSELLSSERFTSLIDSLKNRFDYVLIDSPPLLTVTDGMILSKVADGTILVARGAKTTYDMFGRGLKSLNDIQAHILGIVINALPIRRHDSYYYYQDYYYTAEEHKGVRGSRGRSKKAGNGDGRRTPVSGA